MAGTRSAQVHPVMERAGHKLLCPHRHHELRLPSKMFRNEKYSLCCTMHDRAVATCARAQTSRVHVCTLAARAHPTRGAHPNRNACATEPLCSRFLCQEVTETASPALDATCGWIFPRWYSSRRQTNTNRRADENTEYSIIKKLIFGHMAVKRGAWMCESDVVRMSSTFATPFLWSRM
jgi:hypothetical protein